MIRLCLAVFMGRLLDVSIGTIRTVYTVKGKLKLSFILGFFEALIYFIIVKSAITLEKDLIFIPLIYALGYACGSLLGTYVSHNFINGEVYIQAIVKEDDNLISLIRNNDFGLSIIPLEKSYNNSETRKLLLIQLNKSRLKELLKIINQYDNHAFIILNDARLISNYAVK